EINSANAGGLFGLEYENEDIRAHVLAAEDAIAMIKDGRINNAAAIIALQWLELNRPRLREGMNR
ncbi:MAG: ADP-ribose pyrophosphatase, partial [Pseudomonadales bacterium]